MNTKINLPNINYTCLEIYNVITIVQRIILLNNKQNTSKSEEYNNPESFIKILYYEYEMIYLNLEFTIFYVGYSYNNTETLDSLTNWVSNNYEIDSKNINMVSNLSLTTKLMKLTNDMLKSILPTYYEIRVYVKANCKGLINSVKYFDNEINIFIRERPVMLVCSDNMLQYPMKCSREICIGNQVYIKDYIDKTFLCNRTIAKVLIILFHYYSEIKKVNSTYELIKKEDNEYQIKWSFAKNLSIEEIKTHWLKQEIPDISTRKIIHKFGLMVEYGVEYSTKKSEDTEEEPIKTRLILLSCGHQLGFELIDEFLQNFYIKYDKPLNCHICRHKCLIVGSYDAVVYRCK